MPGTYRPRMSSSTTSTPTRLTSQASLAKSGAMLWCAIIGGLFVLVYWPFLQRSIFIATNGNTWAEALSNLATLKVSGDWSHALVIPVIALYFVKQNIFRLRQLLHDPSPAVATFAPAMRVSLGFLALPGLAMMYLSRSGGLSHPRFVLGMGVAGLCGLLFLVGPPLLARISRPGFKVTLAGLLRGLGLFFFLLGTFSYAWWLGPGRNDMLQGYSMILALFGLLMFALGPAPMGVLWFPVLYLALAVKVAPRWWDMLAWNLRQIAAMLASHGINLLGAPFALEAELKGSTIELMLGLKKIEPAMEVEDACSGLRMLMAFIALGVAMAFMGRRLWWQRAIMVAMCVPIAVIVNVGRILALAFVKVFGNPEMAQGDFHLLIGMFMLIPAAGLFWLLGWVLDKMVVYEDEPTAARKADDPTGTNPTFIPTGTSKLMGWGLGLGLALAGLLGAIYALGLSALRPDLLGLPISQTMTQGLLWASVLGLCVTLVILIIRSHACVKQGIMIQPFTLAVSAGMLLVTAGGLNGMVKASQMVLFKKEVPLRAPLYTLADKAGTWVIEEKLPDLPEEQVQTLGTPHYIRWVYRDKAQPPDQPGSYVLLHVAYYTGTPDTVPHVPERCFVGGGLTPLGSPFRAGLTLDHPRYQEDPQQGWFVDRLNEPTRVHIPDIHVPVTVFRFTHPQRTDFVSTVVYFFSANGRFYPTPDDVRARGFDPRDKYSYYCKIEVMFSGVGDGEKAVQRSSAFLAEILPEIMAALPDWNDVLAGRWPVTP